MRGLEPPTFGSTVRCAAHVNSNHKKKLETRPSFLGTNWGQIRQSWRSRGRSLGALTLSIILRQFTEFLERLYIISGEGYVEDSFFGLNLGRSVIADDPVHL